MDMLFADKAQAVGNNDSEREEKIGYDDHADVIPLILRVIYKHSVGVVNM
jgi:hypothetical protein